MTPITGPFSETWASNPEGPNAVIRSFGSRSWYRQRKPYNLPLTYQVQRGTNDVRLLLNNTLVSSSGWNKSFQSKWRPFVYSDLGGGDAMLAFITSLESEAKNKALARFNAKRGERASLGVTLAETSKTTQMIEQRARQTLKVVSALRHMRLGEAARHLGISPMTVRERARKASSLQLEISFGWMPFIGDMYKAVQVLNAPIPWGVTRGSATVKGDYIVSSGIYGASTHKVKVRAYVAAVLEVERPDLDLASRLGLTNLPGIAYELVPWSFVANWVFNLEEYLAQFEDFPGVRVVNPHYGVSIDDDFAMWLDDDLSPPVSFTHKGSGFGRSFRRTVGSLPTQNLGLRPSIGMGFSRALNAISLLVQKGIRGR